MSTYGLTISIWSLEASNDKVAIRRPLSADKVRAKYDSRSLIYGTASVILLTSMVQQAIGGVKTFVKLRDYNLQMLGVN